MEATGIFIFFETQRGTKLYDSTVHPNFTESTFSF